MRAWRAKLFAIASHSFETSSGGNSILSVATQCGCVSTSTFITIKVTGAQSGVQTKRDCARSTLLRGARAAGRTQAAWFVYALAPCFRPAAGNYGLAARA